MKNQPVRRGGITPWVLSPPTFPGFEPRRRRKKMSGTAARGGMYLSVVSGMTDLFRSILGVMKKKNSATVTTEELNETPLAERVGVMEYALACAVGLLARCLTCCQFRTTLNGKEIAGDEFYSWNYAPNRNQSAADFRTELVARLVLQNECLVVDWHGQFIIAESFQREERPLDGDLFTQVARGEASLGNYPADHVLYFRLANENLRSLMRELYVMYEELARSAADQYQHNGDEKILVNIDTIASGAPDFEDNYNKVMNQQMAPFLKAKRGALPLFKGMSAVPLNSKGTASKASQVTDFEALLAGALDRVGQALGIPPVLLRGTVADQGDAVNRLLSFCVDPIARILETEIVRKRYGARAVMDGTRLWIDTNIQHFDLFVDALHVDKAIASGAACVDEARRRARELELNTEESKKHFITKNYEALGGENKDGT